MHVFVSRIYYNTYTILSVNTNIYLILFFKNINNVKKNKINSSYKICTEKRNKIHMYICKFIYTSFLSFNTGISKAAGESCLFWESLTFFSENKNYIKNDYNCLGMHI